MNKLLKIFKVIAKIRKLENDNNIRQAIAVLRSTKKEIEELKNIQFPMQPRFIEVTQNYINDFETIFLRKEKCYSFQKSKLDLDNGIDWVFQNIIQAVEQ